MSMFAIQVMHGKEFDAQREMLNRMKFYGKTVIQNVIAFEVFTKKFVGEQSAPSKVRSVVPGYIFVQTNDDETSPIVDLKAHAADLWHFIKNTPYVQRILHHSIQDEEFEHFFEIVSDFKDEVILSLEREPEVDCESELLHSANITADLTEKKRIASGLFRKSFVERLLDLQASASKINVFNFNNKNNIIDKTVKVVDDINVNVVINDNFVTKTTLYLQQSKVYQGKNTCHFRFPANLIRMINPDFSFPDSRSIVNRLIVFLEHVFNQVHERNGQTRWSIPGS